MKNKSRHYRFGKHSNWLK